MGARFLAIFIVFICVFEAIDSEGNGELGQNSWDEGFQVTDQHKAEQIWDYCRKKLKYSTEGFVVVEFGSSLSVERIIQKSIVDLPTNEKETVLECLQEENFQLKLLNEKQRILRDEFENLFPDWAGIPRRYLRCKRGKRQLLEITAATPESDDANYPLPLDFDYPSPTDATIPSVAMKKYSPMPRDSSNDNIMYLIAAVIASSMAGIAIAALVLFLCANKDRTDEPEEAQKDNNPLPNLSNGTVVSPDKSNTLSAPNGINFKSSSTVGTSFSDSYGTSQAAYLGIEANNEPFMRIPLPLPPARAAGAARAAAAAGMTSGAAIAYPGTAMGTMEAPTAETDVATGAGVSIGVVAGAKEPESEAAKATVAAAPPPPPLKIPAAAPPPPPKPGHRPPPPLPSKPSPLGPHHRRTSTGDSVASEESGAPKAKLKPFFWDKVLANPDQSMVWHELKGGSFQFDEDMMEALFGYAAADQKKQKRIESSLEATPQFIQIIDPKKSQNLAILLKALNVTSEEVCDALTEGNELPAEFIQNLLKMAPTMDEELKLRLYTGDLSLIGPAERFLKSLIEIPFAFKRLEALLFVSTFQEEFSSVKQSLATLEVACEELKNSRLFHKLLEAVLKTGNRMNDGTYRGGAQAFKLDTLLKLSDVKGTDGKTSLLHFVVHEIIRGEGIRAASRMRGCGSFSSVMTEDLAEDASLGTEEYYQSMGLQEVAGLSSGLLNVKKAALLDHDIIRETVSKLGQAHFKTKKFLENEMKDLEEDSKFLEALTMFVNQCESDSMWLMEEEKRVMDLVKYTGDYFYGRSGKDEGAHLFVIVRDFLVMVDKACQDVKSFVKMPSRVHRRDAFSPSLSPSPSQELPAESTYEMQSRLFPAMKARQLDHEPRSDEEI